MDARQIKDLALQWHQVELEEAAAERLAVMTAAFGDTLGALASNSLFDTEPAHFDRALVAMAKRDD